MCYHGEAPVPVNQTWAKGVAGKQSPFTCIPKGGQPGLLLD